MTNLIRLILPTLSILLGTQCFAQTINGIINSYAQVTGIRTNGTITTFDISNTHVSVCPTCSNSAGEFAVGKKVLIIQMKGVSINTTNSPAFGTITATNNAGNYELAIISAITTGNGADAGEIKSVSVTGLSRSYTATGAVQLVTVPQFTNVTVTGILTGVPWNRNMGYGGIVAMEVAQTLTLSGNISVDGLGYAGGLPNSGNLKTVGGCSESLTYTAPNGTVAHAYGAQKGEGIYDYDGLNDFARGALANGGGGGNSHNGGGGGGGNFSAGGKGGEAWPDTTYCAGSSRDAGGLGGYALLYDSNINKLFMGGGGGSGQQNDGGASSGSSGGGLMLIRANTLTSTCGSAYSLTANATHALGTNGNDGAGGGGAGGTMLVEVNNYSFTCPVNASANGGNGGNVNDTLIHGGGGGGGVGAILLKNAPPPNANFTSTVGANGRDCNTPACSATSTSLAGEPCPASGCAPEGWTIAGTPEPLPIRLIYFQAAYQPQTRDVKLTWQVDREVNNDYYTVERSKDGRNFEEIERIRGAGSSNESLLYSTIDQQPFAGGTYYRLKQTDYNGNFTYSKIVWVAGPEDSAGTMQVFPNPVSQGKCFLFVPENNQPLTLTIIGSSGLVLQEKTYPAGITEPILIDYMAVAPEGLYLLKVRTDSHQQVFKVVVQWE